MCSVFIGCFSAAYQSIGHVLLTKFSSGGFSGCSLNKHHIRGGQAEYYEELKIPRLSTQFLVCQRFIGCYE